MSRHIQTTSADNRKLNNESQKGKLILTNIKGRAVSLLLQNNILVSAQVINISNPSKIGEIYIGKVKNVLKNINAYFVEISNGEICYLSFKDAMSAFVFNRACASKVSTSNDGSADGSKINLVQGDELPVQIIRDAIKTKPAAATTALELSSEYFVLKAGATGLGISNKITKSKAMEIRNLLQQNMHRETLSQDKPAQEKLLQNNLITANGQAGIKHCLPAFGVIARTKCQELDNNCLWEEYMKQREAFYEIYRKARYRTCFSCILANEEPVLAVIRQIPSYEYEEIITDIPEFYEALLSENLKSAGFSELPVRFYEDASISLANLYGLHTKLQNACTSKVWLKSGANLVFEQTECLTTIDVNSSKNIKGTVSEDTIFQVNKEAAKEAAVQIRLRNLSGIIILDFINMKDKDHEQELLDYLRELTSKDPVTTRVVDMTPLGLVEITRKKVNMPLNEQMNEHF